MGEGDDPQRLVGTLADEEAAMRSGRGRILVGWGVVGVALVAGLLLLLGGDDESQAYSDLGKQLNGLKQAQFDTFWGCALEGAVLRDLKNNEDLAFAIDGRGQKGRQAYAEHVRDKCMPLLAEIEPQLDVLVTPGDLTASVAAMGEATGELRSAWSGYISYLDDEELEYDEDAAAPLIAKIGRGWYEFKKAHADLNKVLKTHLEH